MLLSLVTFLPTLGALALLVLRGDDPAAQRNAKWIAFLTTVVTFVASLFVLQRFDASNPDFQLVEERAWLLGLQYKVGVDGISVLFVMLTTFLMPLVIASAWNVNHRLKEYMVAFLLLETLMIGVFVSLDLILFYLFFEGGLIPMFLIIGIWGGSNRIYAAFKFFLYTFLGSVFMLIAMVVMAQQAGTTDIPTLMAHEFSSEPFRLLNITVLGGLQTMLFIGFFLSFAVKMPMWPVHTWLPDAHVQAPTAGSVVLAAILLKMGGYGLPALLAPHVPRGLEVMQPMVLWLSAIAVVYASLVALVQTDMKKLVAYSSVRHMGFVTMGILAANEQGVDGAIFQMLSHGFISAALFLIVGRDLRPDAHARDRGLWRPRQPDAGLCGSVPAVHHGQRGPAGDVGLRGRVPDAGRHLPGEHLGRGRWPARG
jgi:NADH-quinone oxidoreductase subunit M